MKIAILCEFYHPSVGGVQFFAKILAEGLAKKGNEVFVITSFEKSRDFNELNKVKINDFNVSGNFVKTIKGDIEKFYKFIYEKRNYFDIIVIIAAQTWISDLFFPILSNLSSKKIFIPTGFSMLFSKGYNEYYEKMKYWMRLFDANVFLGKDYIDYKFALESGITKNVIIPNGASLEEFLSLKNDGSFKSKYNIPPDNLLVVHIGSHTGLKGHKEALKIFEKAKIKDATFALIGNVFSKKCYNECRNFSDSFNSKKCNKKNNKKILLLTDISRKETLQALAEADMFLFPSNVECSPIVLFEAMASKTPFLATEVGNIKEIIRWSNSGILLPTIRERKKINFGKAKIDESSKILEDILINKDERKKLAENGYNAWLKNFTWEKIIENYEKLFVRLLENKSVEGLNFACQAD